MRARVTAWFKANGRLILVTFEVFWILVFVLDRVTSANSVDVPQFIYVNF